MTYIVQRQDRFYVVAYDGLDPLSGKERRRWHPVGHDRDEAEAVRRRLELEPRDPRPAPADRSPWRRFSTRRGCHANDDKSEPRPPTATPGSSSTTSTQRSATSRCAGYASIISRACTSNWPSPAADTHDGLAPKTILEVHMIVRAALGLAADRQLVVRNVAASAQLKLPRAGGPIARSWTASELATFLATARHHRLYPALHLAAHTGMRRGEIVGLKWCDLDTAARRLSIRRTVQCVGGQPVEFGVKTRTSRRTVELDHSNDRPAATLAATTSTRRPPERHRRLDVLQPDRPLPQPTIADPTVRPHRAQHATSHGSDSTTCATPTPRCSSPPASRSRSCPNDSVTPTRRSRSTPTSTCYPA